MPTITIEITDAEDAAIQAVTKMTSQKFLEMNARAHVADCVGKKRMIDYVARGVPSQVASALFDDELELIANAREEKAAAKAEAEKLAAASEPLAKP